MKGSWLRILGIALFATLAFGLIVAAHFYLDLRLIRDVGFTPGVERSLRIGLGLLALTLVLQPLGERLLHPPWSRVIAWPASLWMGFAFYLLLILLASDGLLWLGSTAARAAELGDTLPEGRTRAGFALVVSALAVARALRGGLREPDLRRVEVRLPRWPRSLDGFRIAQISDIHIGPLLGRRFARHITDRTNALAADLIAVTGDLVDGSVRQLTPEVAPFGDLRAPLGVFFVTGNHDHYSGAHSWAEHAAELGMRVLRNERTSLGEGDAVFDLAGVDDHHAHFLPGEHGEDLERALAGRDPERPLLLLAHDPSTFKRASGMGIDLQLSGHTHGGQIWPFSLLVRLAVPFLAGLYKRGAAQLYVSRGTGFWGPPMRLGAPAEITELVLRSAPAGTDPGGASKRSPKRLRTAAG